MNDAKHLFKFLLDIWISSFTIKKKKKAVQILCPLKKFSCLSFLYLWEFFIVDKRPLLQTDFTDTFSQSVACLFTLLKLFLDD